MVRLRAWIDRHPIIRRIIFFFPVQLLLVQVKKNPILIIFWAIMFGFLTGSIASKYGVSLLFVDPEYIGHVNFLSYFLIGFSCGGFVMAYQISCYIYNAFRFPFLATLSRPFLRFCTNNFIIPVLFQLTYLVLILRFLHNEPISKLHVFGDVLGFIGGNLFFILGSLFYFFRTTKDMQSLYGIGVHEREYPRSKRIILNRDPLSKKLNWKAVTPGKEGRDWHVESYLSGLKIRRARPFEHYDKELLNRVFMQNHGKAVWFEVVVILTLLVFGFFRGIPALMIPAGASVFLLFTLYLMFTGVLTTWFRGWSNTIFVLLLLVFNFMHKFDLLDSRTCAYGMNYNVAPAIYSNKAITDFSESTINRHADSIQTISILENWKKKNSPDSLFKPKMIILSCSGGGLRSTMWTFYTMQYLDSISGGEFLPHTALICGSSGGMLGAAFMREIYLREQNGDTIKHTDPSLRKCVSDDVLNPVAFSIAVNDWFLPLRHADYHGKRYSRDRAYAFEEKFLENTKGILEKKLSDYTEPEARAEIPMMFFAPTIVNDGRKLIIASQGVSYLTEPTPDANVTAHIFADGIEFSRFFKQQDADSVRFMSVLRMNATFPYITPLTELPSKPAINVFDAGMRDNYGMDNVLRFLYMFRTWIAENTSGVVIVQTRDKNKLRPVEDNGVPTMFQSLTMPLNSFYGNLFTVQDYNHDYEIQQAAHWFGGKLDFIDFELNNEQPDVISLSWHLTNREKNKVLMSMSAPDNLNSARRFVYLMNEPEVNQVSASAH
ncbi:MAG TPA: patatin-like phospholipase family protein [Bacteroidia bacterium]|jgi:hypothetical protein|nr:patatin-like phospholipase family protein [Bacteroidia bacterium]